MSIPLDLRQINFHDSGLTAISREGQTFFLSLENVEFGDEQLLVNVTITGVEAISRNKLPLSELLMETDDGEVLRLEKEDKHILFILRWYKYSPSSHEVVVYYLCGLDVSIQAELAQADVDENRFQTSNE